MKKTASIIATTAAAALFSTASWAVVLGNGGAALQGVLDGITINPAGVSSVDVNTDQASPDEYWQVGGSGGSVSTVVIELAGFASNTSFGIYDKSAPGSTVELFGGAATTGSQTPLSILADGSIVVNFADTGIDFAANAFGYYIDTTINQPGVGLWYSDEALNSDGVDHMAAYQGVGDTIQIAPFAAGPWGANEYILAFEDLNNGGDRDYTDFVVLVESVSPIPVPATLALMGLGLLGFAARRRKA